MTWAWCDFEDSSMSNSADFYCEQKSVGKHSDYKAHESLLEPVKNDQFQGPNSDVIMVFQEHKPHLCVSATSWDSCLAGHSHNIHFPCSFSQVQLCSILWLRELHMVLWRSHIPSLTWSPSTQAWRLFRVFQWFSWRTQEAPRRSGTQSIIVWSFFGRQWLTNCCLWIRHKQEKKSSEAKFRHPTKLS